MREPKWETRDELRFLYYLGTGRWADQKRLAETPGRAEALRKYLRAVRRRKDWGQVDRDFVLIFARRQLREAEARWS